MPKTLYKYAPSDYIKSGKRGFPLSLRSTQPSALNDMMECSLITTKGWETDDYQWVKKLSDTLTERLGFSVSAEFLAERKNKLGDPMISTIIKKHLDQYVGVVSFFYRTSGSKDVGVLRSEFWVRSGLQH